MTPAATSKRSSPPPPRALRREMARGELALGELSVIDGIRRRAASAAQSASRELRLGIGDDCAILRPRPGEDIVVTTDFSLEGRHFRRDWHPAQAVGHRALARGLSDLAAMGARPVAAFLSLAVPKAVAADGAWLNGFLDGLFALADRFGVPLAGGDTSEAPDRNILVDIVLLGAVPSGRALRRDAARAGDRLYCTGTLGGAAAELQTLPAAARAGRNSARAESAVSLKMPQPPGARASETHPHLFPEPRFAVGQTLLRRRLAAAAIDLSDGLSTDLHHLCQASGVAAEIDGSRLPLHPLAAALGPEAALRAALHGGEDYQLLFSARPRTKLPSHLAGTPITEIGRCLAPRRGRPTVTLLHADGQRSTLKPRGWEHLR